MFALKQHNATFFGGISSFFIFKTHFDNACLKFQRGFYRTRQSIFYRSSVYSKVAMFTFKTFLSEKNFLAVRLLKVLSKICCKADEVCSVFKV